MKNLTQLRDALLGTWTVWTDLRASVGDYRVRAYTVVRFDVDPMQHYSCQRAHCRETQGKLCQKVAHQQQQQPNPSWQEECTDISSQVSSWSDMVVYVQTGFAFHAGAPFWMSHNATTGATHWMGPYNIVWAVEEEENDDDEKDHPTATAANSTTTTTTTTYVSRYVQTYMTPYLSQRPPDETLLAGDEFQAALGPAAVRATLDRQVAWNWTTGRPDPYASFRGTCQAGNLTPTLPQYRLTFATSSASNGSDGGDDDTTGVNVQVDYALLVAPGAGNRASSIMPWMARQINRQQYGFSLQGPYCWGNDPNRAYVWCCDLLCVFGACFFMPCLEYCRLLIFLVPSTSACVNALLPAKYFQCHNSHIFSMALSIHSILATVG